MQMKRGTILVTPLIDLKIKEGQEFYSAYRKFCKQVLSKGRILPTKNAYAVYLRKKYRGRKGGPEEVTFEVNRCMHLLHDLRLRGLKDPIVFTVKGSIADGAHRLASWEALGKNKIRFRCPPAAIPKMLKRYKGIIEIEGASSGKSEE